MTPHAPSPSPVPFPAKRIAAGVACVLAMALLAPRPAAGGVEFSSPAVVNANAATDTGFDGAPAFSADGSTWIVAWRSRDDLGGTIGTDEDLLFARSADAGATWSGPAALNSYAASDGTSLNDADGSVALASGAGTTVAVWVSQHHLGAGGDSDIVVSRSADGGETWSTTSLLSADFTTDSGDDSEPALATDGAGTWTVVWQSDDPRGDTLGTDLDLLVSRSTDDGVTWSAPAALDPAATGDALDDRNPTVATDGDGTWIVVWSQGDEAGSELVSTRSVDDGASWQTPVLLSPDVAAHVSYPQVASNGADGWMVVFAADSFAALALTSADDGATWSPPVTVAMAEVYPRLGSLGGGSWITVWGDNLDGDFDIYSSESLDGGQTWSTPAAVHSNAATDVGDDTQPVVGRDALGRLVVVWGSAEDLGGEIDTDADILFVWRMLPDLIFADDFESGDTAAWLVTFGIGPMRADGGGPPSVSFDTAHVWAIAGLASGAPAATITVAADAVAVAADGQCSLREAIHNANADAQVDNGDCPAGSGADVLALASGAIYTITDADPGKDANGLPVVTSDITIEGNGATLERDSGLGCVLDGVKAAGEFRLLEIDSPGNLTLEDLTLRGGCADGSGPPNDGGAMRLNFADLTLTRVLVEGNSAWDKSGALDVNGLSVTITDSTLRGNYAGGGAGAIGVGSGTVTIEGSTISGNSSAGAGGGGIGNYATLTLRNSTLSGNSSTGSGGGGIGNQGTLQVEDSTIVGNSVTGALGGGGIGNVGAAEVKNSIVAGNTSGGDCVNVGPGTFAAFGQSFDGDGSCAALDGVHFSQVAYGDLELGSLADNGGPTETHALGDGSVAIDVAGDCTRFDGSTAVSADQRGVPRPLDGDGNDDAICDAGAFEAVPALRVDGVTCTLGDAIEAANLDTTVGGCVADGAPEPDQIFLDADVVLDAADTARSSFLQGAYAGLPDVTSEITLAAGNGGSSIARNASLTCDVADSADEFRLLQVVGSGSLTLDGLTLSGGCADRGGAVLVTDSATLAAAGVTFTGNTARMGSGATAQGGAVWAASTTAMTITGSLFQDNLAAAAGAEGGALWENGALVSLTDSRFLGNEARAVQDFTTGGVAFGGAAWVGAPAMSRLVFADNVARGADATGHGGAGHGGGLIVVGSGATLADALFARNTARGGDGNQRGGSGYGGAILTDDYPAVIERVTLVDNVAEGGTGGMVAGGLAEAGGLFSYGVQILDHLTLSGNEARGGGSTVGAGGPARAGGLLLQTAFPGGTLLRHSTIAENRAIAGSGPGGDGTAEGGGLVVEDPLQIVSSLLEGNSATVGAATTASPCWDLFSTSVTSLGYNTVAEAAPDCAFSGPGDQTDVGPSLLPLGEYGCTTPLPGGSCLPTHPVDLAGPAIDQGSCTASGATSDARGLSRPVDLAPANVDDGCDPGAYESRDTNGNGVEDGLDPLFADGFESGDTTAWSSAVP